MTSRASTNKAFLGTLEHWLRSQREILVPIRHPYAGGNKSFEFFTSPAALSERLRQLPPRTSVIAFRQPQLPLRGIVDDDFIETCLSNILEGSEFLVVETAQRTYGGAPWFHRHGGRDTR